MKMDTTVGSINMGARKKKPGISQRENLKRQR